MVNSNGTRGRQASTIYLHCLNVSKQAGFFETFFLFHSFLLKAPFSDGLSLLFSLFSWRWLLKTPKVRPLLSFLWLVAVAAAEFLIWSFLTVTFPSPIFEDKERTTNHARHSRNPQQRLVVVVVVYEEFSNGCHCCYCYCYCYDFTIRRRRAGSYYQGVVVGCYWKYFTSIILLLTASVVVVVVIITGSCRQLGLHFFLLFPE
jgi:hypothetical protein